MLRDFFHLHIKENAMNVEIFQKLKIMKKVKEQWINELNIKYSNQVIIHLYF